MSVLLAFLALSIELAVGYPDRLYRAIGHPVSWIGQLIGWLDRTLNRDSHAEATRRAAGVLALAFVLLTAVSAGGAIQYTAGAGAALLATAVAGSTLLAQRSLARHIADVAAALESDAGLAAGRDAVARIVGRDPESLDEAGVARAAIESLAENFSDGVIAPAFWLAVAGLPGAAAYKAINTADSMIGHRTPRHAAFGWSAARLDDLVNLPASRLSALLLVAAAVLTPGASPGDAARAAWRDAPRHRSPNAGWPEGAMAGALGLALAGPRRYGGVVVEDAMMGEGGRREAAAADIRRALRLYWCADLIFVATIGVLGAVFMLHG